MQTTADEMRIDDGSSDVCSSALEQVRESSLAAIARALDLGPKLILGPGEMKSGGHRRDSILSDALEALVGAIYLDAGFDACREVVLPWFAVGVNDPPAGKVGKDATPRLQEWLQARQSALRDSGLGSEHGAAHANVLRLASPIRRATG